MARGVADRIGALALLPLLVGGVVLASCTPEPADGGSTRADAELTVLTGPDGLIVLVGPRQNAGDDALLEGTLALDAGGCAAVQPAWDPQVTVLVRWPAGTKPLTDAAGLDVPGIGRVGVGSEVALGGGFHDPAGLEIPADCVAGTEYFGAWNAS